MTLKNSNGANVMMTLGQFQFSISTAAYQELTRVTEWRWPSQERFRQGQALQFLGPGGDTITLPGVILPEWRGGTGQVDAMRAWADQGEPLTMIDGEGFVMGRWVIERIEEKQSVFAAAGIPRKQEFTINLRKFDDAATGSTGGEANGINGAVDAAGAAEDAGISFPIEEATGATSVASAGPLSGLSSLTSTVITTATSAASAITAAAVNVASFAAEIGDAVEEVLEPINRAVNVANGLKNAASDAKKLLGSIPNNLSGISSATKLLSAATTAAHNSTAAGTMIKRSLESLTDLGTIPADALNAVQGAMIDVNKLTVAAVAAYESADDLVEELSA